MKKSTHEVWVNDTGDTMILRFTDGMWYGISNEFDFERETKEEAHTQLKKWGFEFIGYDN